MLDATDADTTVKGLSLHLVSVRPVIHTKVTFYELQRHASMV